MTAQEWLEMAEANLRDAGVDTPRLDAQLLLTHYFDETRTWLLAHLDEPVEEDKVLSFLTRRCKREPLAYIIGSVEFYGRPFRVYPSVLIPRQDTETLIDAVLEADLPQGSSVLDVGTGSGCIAITLNRERPDLIMMASDISARAVGVAKSNAVILNANVRFELADGIPPAFGRKLDALVSNPPYIDPETELMPEVSQFEPHIALFAGMKGFQMYVKLAYQAEMYRVKRVFVEIGKGMESEVIEIFRVCHYDLIKCHSDLSGIIRVLHFDSRSLVSEPLEPRQPLELEWTDDFPGTPPSEQRTGPVLIQR